MTCRSGAPSTSSNSILAPAELVLQLLHGFLLEGCIEVNPDPRLSRGTWNPSFAGYQMQDESSVSIDHQGLARTAVSPCST